MTIYLHNRVKETTTTSGTGDITLAGAADSFQAFSAVLSDGQQTYYTVVSTNDWEVGIGTYTAGTLSRDTILSSSNSGSAISLSGTSTVFIAYPSEKSVYKDENDQVVVGASGILLSSGVPANTSNALYTNGTALFFNGIPIAGAAYTAGTGLQLDGLEFNIDDTVLQSGDNVSFLTNDAGYLTEHPSITSASSSDNSGRTYIQDILLDDNGHVTGVATATETVVDTDTTYTAGTGLSLVGTEFNIDNTFNLQEVTDRGSNTTNSIFTSGNITATSGYFDTLDMTPLGNGSQPPHLEGRLFYDSDNHTLSLYNDEADVSLQLGQEQFLRVRNNTGSTITNGTAVFITGAHGSAAPTISGAIATSESSAQVVGLSTHDIEDNSFGYVTTYGIVRDVDTSQYSDGDEIFLSATQIGSGVNVSPTIPNYKVTIGHVIRSHDSNGSVLVQVGNPKLGGGDLKSEAALNMSGVPFVTSISDITAGGSQTDPLFVFDSGNRQLQVGSGIQLLDGVPSNTSNVLYNDSGSLYFNGSEVGGSESDTLATVTARGATTAEDVSFSGLVSINSPSGAAVPLTIQGITGQTGNYLNILDSTGDEEWRFPSTANRINGQHGFLETAQFGGSTGNGVAFGAVFRSLVVGTNSIITSEPIGWAPSIQGSNFNIYATVAATGNNLVSFHTDSLQNEFASIEASGASLYNLSIDNDVASDVPVIVRGAVSQSANLQEWQDSSEVVKAYIDNDGSIMVSGVMASGHVQLAENTPADTTNKLYNSGGSLYFNGSEVAGGVDGGTP